MDETSVLSPFEKRRGFFLRKRRTPASGKGFVRSGQRRCSLMGAICDDAAVQRQLPQVLLPRNRMKKEPGERLKRIYASMGAPLEVWHGSSGSVDRDVLIQWLRRIRQCVDQLVGSVEILLSMDCCPVHISEDILRAAKRLHMHVVPTPARCTWFLQTLDAKIFHHLKRLLRQRLMATEVAEVSGVLKWQQQVDAIADSVQAVLVRRSWIREMAEMGMNGDDVPTSSAIGKLVAGEDVMPRPPNQAELLQILGKSSQACQKDWMTLFRLNEIVAPQLATASSVPNPESCEPDAMNRPTSVTTPTSATSSSSKDKPALKKEPTTHHGVLRLSNQHRLPPALNKVVKVEPPTRVGPSAGTRSRTSLESLD